jgi:alpha-tubulin suppressor-like RCC1 family protein
MRISRLFSFFITLFVFIAILSSSYVSARMSKIVSVFAGYDYSGLIDDRGSVFIFGNGSLEKQQFSKREFLRESPIKIVFSETSIYVLTSEGSVFRWGTDPNDYGLLAQNDNTEIIKPLKISNVLFNSEDIVDIASSNHHIIVTTTSGKAYGWGSNTFGELLNSNPIERTPIALNIGIAKVVQVEVSENTTAFIDRSGNLWMSGDNSSNQLGSSSDSFISSKILRKVTPMTNFQYVTDIALGNDFTVAINNSGRMISFGNSQDSRLGIITVEPKLLPSIVSDDMEYVFQVSAFKNGVIALGSTGKMYAFGKNQYGIIGQDQYIDMVETPTLINNSHLFNVKEIVTGSNHAIALTNDYSVLVWGNNEKMQLGTTGLMNYFSSPIPVITYEKSHFFTYFISVLILLVIIFDEVIFTIVYYEKEKSVLSTSSMKLLK